MSPLVLAGCLAGVIALFAGAYMVRGRSLSRRLKRVRAAWEGDGSTFDVETAGLLSRLDSEVPPQAYRVDDHTWNDLDLGTVFARINRTISPVGAQCLYHMLRNPVFSSPELEVRERLIDRFLCDPPLRERIQLILLRLSDRNVRYLPHSLWEPLPDRPRYAAALPFISYISCLALVLALFKVISFLVPIGIFFLNLGIRTHAKRRIEIYIQSFQYLGVMIAVAERLSACGGPELAEIRESLRARLKAVRGIAGKIYTMQFKDEFGLIEYINTLFLWDIIGFHSVVGDMKKHIRDLRAVYETIGYLDALISAASFRSRHPRSCQPSLHTGDGAFRVTGIYNPLLANPVPNTFAFDSRQALITGSNMAGKTTFLRTMGVNAILAQSIHTSLAESYEAPFVTVISTMGISDSLVLGKSYYLAEVESILHLLRASETDTVHLFFLDEIFRGTNSEERLAISIEVMKYLANGKDYLLLATHDLHLAKALDHVFDNYHFRERVGESGLMFDYTIHTGPSTTRNAIALLEYAGYPKRIVDNARGQVRNSPR